MDCPRNIRTYRAPHRSAKPRHSRVLDANHGQPGLLTGKSRPTSRCIIFTSRRAQVNRLQSAPISNSPRPDIDGPVGPPPTRTTSLGEAAKSYPTRQFFSRAITAQAGTQGSSLAGERVMTLDRTSHDLHSQLGLDPEPGPALTRLPAGGAIESPTVFLGAFAGGPDGAGNQLRPWVRAVLGSPRTWAELPLSAHRKQQLGRRHAGERSHRPAHDRRLRRPGPGDVPPRCRLVSRSRGLVSESQNLSPRISPIGR